VPLCETFFVATCIASDSCKTGYNKINPLFRYSVDSS